MSIYTDPQVLDVAAAVESLPPLQMEGGQLYKLQAKATGTDSHRAGAPDTSNPKLTAKADKRCNLERTADNWPSAGEGMRAQKTPKHIAFPEVCPKLGSRDLNPD